MTNYRRTMDKLEEENRAMELQMRQRLTTETPRDHSACTKGFSSLGLVYLSGTPGPDVLGSWCEECQEFVQEKRTPTTPLYSGGA